MRCRTYFTGLLLAAAFGISAAAPAFAAGDAKDGRTLARHWCAACHIVERRAVGTVVDGAPPFVAIANRPGRDAGYLRAFLSDPHPPMSGFDLMRAEIDDFVAYIRSLKDR